MAARGNYAKGISTRQEILEVALEVYSRQGYGNTSVREIARQTGLSQAGLLHHFNSKQELFVEVLRLRDTRNRDAQASGDDRSMTVEGLVEVVRHNAEEPELVRLFATMSSGSTSASNPSHDFFQDRYVWLRGELADDVRNHQAAGELAADLDPVKVASLLVAAADGLQVQWLLDAESGDMGASLQWLWQTLQRVR